MLRYALAAGLPTVAYLATATGAGYWIDGGEFVATAFGLGVSHPPGHPLAGLYGKAFTLLPLGSIAARVAWGQALAAGAAAGFVYAAIERTLVAVGTRRAVTTALALAGTWLGALAYGSWVQAVRPEVYALETLLLCIALERVVSIEARMTGERAGTAAALGTAGLALGLGLTNHHYAAVLVTPAIAWTALRAASARGARVLAPAAALGVLALGTYAYLPLRGLADAPGAVVAKTPAEVAWTAAALMYSRERGLASPVPLGERFGEMLVVLVEQFHGVFVLAALCGLYALVRVPRTRGLGVAWGLVALVGIVVRAGHDPVRGNPDALGYIGPAFAAVGALAVVLPAALVVLVGDRPRLATPFAVGSALLAVAVAALGLASVGPRVSLADFHGTDPFTQRWREALPPRAVVVATTPAAVFQQWQATVTEEMRPDVTLVPLPFLRYPGIAARVAREDPEVGAFARAYLTSDALAEGPLRKLAARRPVFLELDAETAPALHASLVPDSLLYGVAETTPAELDAAARARTTDRAQLARELGADARERETARQLVWGLYLDAVYYAGRGRTDLARVEVARAEATYPGDAHVAALAHALAHAPAGRPFDVRRFLALDEPPGSAQTLE